MGARRCRAEPSTSVLFVFAIVAGKPQYVTIPFEGKNMRGDAIQKPAVMGDNHRGAGEGLKRIFQGLAAC